ncbi:hypothetical protein [Streptomyces cucumeris]|uniref:hypothetical protein n=1 Tax=Streptomyces cucumeris TaxID=2962890 RepID=UPI003D71606D
MSFRLPLTRRMGIAALLTLLVTGSGTWWLVAESGSADTISLPERVCDRRVSGKQAASLLPTQGARLQEETTQFSIRSQYGSCRLETGEEYALIMYLYGSGKYPPDHFRGKTHRASLGNATGYLTREGGFSLYVPCTSPPRDDKGGLTIETSASIVRSAIASGARLGSSTKGLKDLSAFTTQVVHNLAEDWFKCPGADRLPDTPVTIHWDR